MPDALFLPGLMILIPDRALWNGEALQRQEGIYTDGSNLSRGISARIFCRELCLELHFRLKEDDCSVF